MGKWSQEEVALLEEKYKTLTMSELETILKRTKIGIRRKANKLGLFKVRSFMVKCSNCEKIIKINKNTLERNNNNFCSRKCQGEWHSLNMVGEKASNYKNALIDKKCLICGKEFKTYHKTHAYCSVECKSKPEMNRKVLVCNVCGKEFKRTISEIYWGNQRGNENIFCSKKCKNKYHVGENHPCYIKDRTQIKDKNKSIRGSKKMRDWRKLIYKRDNYTCQLCGNRSGKNNPVILNAHHIKRFIDNEDLRFDVNNGITLCECCHKLTYGKERDYEEKFNNTVKLMQKGDGLC